MKRSADGIDRTSGYCRCWRCRGGVTGTAQSAGLDDLLAKALLAMAPMAAERWLGDYRMRHGLTASAEVSAALARAAGPRRITVRRFTKKEAQA